MKKNRKRMIPAVRSYGSWPVFLVFLRLGLTSFGGPVAHLGYFRDEFVTRRQWFSERSYADLVALCQFLPGPASSQLGMALGLSRSGYAGALAAWAGFTLPSAIAMVLFASGMSATSGSAIGPEILHGLKIVAVAVVAQAVVGMARHHCPDWQRAMVMMAAAGAVLFVPSARGQISVILAGGIAGLVLSKPRQAPAHEPLPIVIGRRMGAFWLALFFFLLAGLPILAPVFQERGLFLLDAFYRAGSLVFGGGHVVLPLLQAEVVPSGWVSNDVFLAGYGAAQAVPGPLFSFAAFLGASMGVPPSGWTGGLLCLGAIFLPSFLLVFGALPFWEQLRSNVRVRSALTGVNAAVVGLLLAALYHPVCTSAIHRPADLGLALVGLIALVFWKLPAWALVAGGAAGGWLAGAVS